MSNDTKNTINVAGEEKPYASLVFDGLEVNVYRGEDGKLVVDLLGPEDDDCLDDGQPDIRVWMNEALIYRSGETGDDLAGGHFPVPLETNND